MSVLDQIKKMRQEAKQSEPRYFPSRKGGTNINPGNFTEGKTIMRIAESHDPIKNPSPFYPFRSTMLMVELGLNDLTRWNMNNLIESKPALLKDLGIEKLEDLSEWEDGIIRSKLEDILGKGYRHKVNKRIFSASMHAKEGSLDLVEEYIKFVVKDTNDKIGDRDEARKKLSPIFGYRGKDGKWQRGINPSTNWVFYAWDWSSNDKTFHRVEIYDGMMKNIEELFQKFDDPEKPLTIDPFAHPEEGIGVVFEKYKNDKNKFEFNIYESPFDFNKYNTGDDFKAVFKLTEERLNELKEAQPLCDMFGRNSFKKKDFDLQLNGLFMFDAENGYNIFENHEFIEMVEKIGEQFETNEPPYNPLTGEGVPPSEKRGDALNKAEATGAAIVKAKNPKTVTDIEPDSVMENPRASVKKEIGSNGKGGSSKEYQKSLNEIRERLKNNKK